MRKIDYYEATKCIYSEYIFGAYWFIIQCLIPDIVALVNFLFYIIRKNIFKTKSYVRNLRIIDSSAISPVVRQNML